MAWKKRKFKEDITFNGGHSQKEYSRRIDDNMEEVFSWKKKKNKKKVFNGVRLQKEYQESIKWRRRPPSEGVSR
jgi:hypothetical protein